MIYYDPFIMEDPHFGALIRAAASEQAQIMVKEAEIIAAAKAEVLAEAKAEILSLTTIKNTLLRIVEARFPELGISGTHGAILPDTREALEVLIVKVATAPSVNEARRLLALPVFK